MRTLALILSAIRAGLAAQRQATQPSTPPPAPWPTFDPDLVTAKGDAAYWAVWQQQQERDRRCPNDPRHAAWLTTVTGEFNQIVSRLVSP